MNSETAKQSEDAVQMQLLEELKQLLLWRSLRNSLIVFTSVLILMMDAMAHSVISVVSMAGITLILVACGHRCLARLSGSWKKDGIQDQELRLFPLFTVEIPREEAMRLAGIAVDRLNAILNRLVALFLVENWEDSLKFLAIMCGINLLGDCFNGLTLLMFGHVLLFTLPKVYERYQAIIDLQLQKLRSYKQKKKSASIPLDENKDNLPEEHKQEEPLNNQESGDDNMLYKVCDNAQLFDLLAEEHRKGCRCGDCEHQDLPIEAL
ncbi:hypothetical protein KR009_006094 [Drosophila setifemur]|nr:hypothetical protein KR009_006094 [Drosophila setifemur]